MSTCGDHPSDLAIKKISDRLLKLNETKCQILIGYPSFFDIWESADAWRITLMTLNILLVLIVLLILIKEAKFMHTYFREKTHRQGRHQRKLIYMEASLQRE